MDFEAARFAKSLNICAETLAMAAMLGERKDWLGRVKLNAEQKGWAFGFCDGWGQSIGLADDGEFILFISMAFQRTWGERGLTFFREVLHNQDRFVSAIMAGGTAHHSWAATGKSPLMPR